jgi:hypothetical protein
MTSDRAALTEALRHLEVATSPNDVLAASDSIEAHEPPAPIAEEAGNGSWTLRAAALERCIARLDPAATDAKVADSLAASLLMALARGGDERASTAPALAWALALHDGADWAYVTGLYYKYRRRWPEALAANQRAFAGAPDNEACAWNLGISATGAGNGEVAASAWRALGMPARLGDDGLPVVDHLGPIEVRLPPIAGDPSPRLAAEFVWVQPQSPCHGVVLTATFADHEADVGDVILWDGAPVRQRVVQGTMVPGFPVLARLRAGGTRTFRFVAMQSDSGAVSALTSRLPAGCELYAHEEKTRLLCAQCASGIVHECAPAARQPDGVVSGKLVVPREVSLAVVRDRLATLTTSGGGAGVRLACPSMHDALGDARAAADARAAWQDIAGEPPLAASS